MTRDSKVVKILIWSLIIMMMLTTFTALIYSISNI